MFFLVGLTYNLGFDFSYNIGTISLEDFIIPREDNPQLIKIPTKINYYRIVRRKFTKKG